MSPNYLNLCGLVAPRVPNLINSGYLKAVWRDFVARHDMALLDRTYWSILDFGFGGRTEHGYEMALDLLSEADSGCVLHHFSSLARLKGSWGQVWSENGPTPKLKSGF
jgi:hypothetical protein